jgi:hypothetical protein
MKRAVWLAAIAATMVFTTSSTYAASLPVVRGVVSGVELCEQAVCGSAVFVGLFDGQVGWNRWARGIVAVGVNHEPLPAPGEYAAITGGEWALWVGLRRLGGSVSGSLFNNGDNTFTVTTVLTLESGGLGTIVFTGLLDHNVFPPTISGVMSQ